MARNISFTVKYWKQDGPNAQGHFDTHEMKNIPDDTSFLEMLDPIRARRHEFEQDIPEVFNILKKGSEDAREFAAQTMDEVRKAMRIDYFSDAAYIEEQAAKFRI